MDVELVPVTVEDRAVLANLLQLYLHDYSEFEERELTAHGTFEYPWLDTYFLTPDREPYLITVAGRPAGFALARCDADRFKSAWDFSEFFVTRAHRGRGVATRAANLLLQRHPGTWTISYLAANEPAGRFWPKLADAAAVGQVAREEQSDSDGKTRVHLRFETKTR